MKAELKLDLSQAAAAVIRESDLLPADPTSFTESSTYFDTPDQALLRAGLSLRLSRSRGQCIEAVWAVAGNAAGLSARSEWEQAVAEDRPILDPGNPVTTLLGPAMSELAPVFTVQVKQHLWMVTEDDAQIELVMACGEASSGAVRALFCELELELKDGSVAALFTLARMLDRVAPVRLGIRTEAERGYGLSQPKRLLFKAEAVLLTQGMTAAEAFQHSAQACIRHFRLNEDLVLAEQTAGPLHQARVALRRLRSALSIYRPLLGLDPTGARLREELRWLSGELGEARNLDVLLDRGQSGALHDRLLAERGIAYGRVTEALHSSRARTIMLDLAEWMVVGEWLNDPATAGRRSQPARDFAVTRLNRYRRRLKNDGSELETAEDEARHEVRKEAKRLRYASEFFQGLFSGKRERRRYKRFIAHLEELQDQLGALNDLATAPKVLHDLGVADDPEAVSLLVDGNKAALVKAAADAHVSLVESERFWS